MLHGVYAVVDGDMVQGVSAQDGMPGCKIGCRICPDPEKYKMEFYASKGVLDGLLKSVSYCILHFQFIPLEHSYKAKLVQYSESRFKFIGLEHFGSDQTEQFQIDQLQKMSTEFVSKGKTH